jgi:Protein of unknown function (DUF3298)/Deacetylase PdaC
MKKKYFLFLIGSLILFTYCKNEKPNETKIPTITPSVSTASKGFYKHFKGTIDAFAVTMDLVQIKNSPDAYTPFNFRGHYYYDKYQHPISLYGELDSAGDIILHEAILQQDKDIYFIGKLDASGSFSGTWQDTASKRKLPFTLKETNADGALAFDFHTFEDSVKGWKNVANSPVAIFDMQLILPSKNVESSLSAFLKDRILGGIYNDTIEKSYANIPLEALQNAQRDTFFKNYLTTMAEEKPDSSELAPVTMNHAESHSQYVLFNEKDLLSLGFGIYEYSGGAHGNHATGIASYDLAQKKTLKINDIFMPKFEKTLNAALAKAVRKQFGMKSNEPLSSNLFDNKIEYTNNFCITKKGILFLYNPYEIAAYAYGEIELFIPFEEVKSVVNPRFLQ